MCIVICDQEQIQKNIKIPYTVLDLLINHSDRQGHICHWPTGASCGQFGSPLEYFKH